MTAPRNFYDAFDKPTPASGGRERAPVANEAPARANEPYAAAALASEVERVATAANGTRNDTLNRAAFSLAQLVAGGALDENDVVEQLTAAGQTVGLEPREAATTIASGLRAGKQHPRSAPARVHEGTEESTVLGLGSSVPSTVSSPRQVRVTWADTITPKVVTWAWLTAGTGRIAAGTLALAAGREGTGKSSFGIWLTARITTGTLPGTLHGVPRRVLFAAIEDSWAHTLVPRLIAADADLSMVGRVDVTSSRDDELVLSLPDDLAALEAVVIEHQIAMVVLDPLLSMIGDHIDTHRNREVREALDPLARLADRTGAVVLGIAHFNKSSGTDAAALISGSGAFKDVPRSVFGFARDDDGRVMTQVKNSLGRDDLPSLTYGISAEPVTVDGGTTEVGVFTFLGESDRTVGDVLRTARDDTDDTDARSEAVEWLLKHLTDQGGEGIASDIIKAAARDGIARTTLTRARSRAGVTSTKDGFGGPWIWRMTPPVTHLVESRPSGVAS